MVTLSALGLFVALCWVAHRFALFAEKRGWIYYTNWRRGARIGNALMEVQSIWEPAKQNLVVEMARTKVEQDDNGDPPEK